MEALPNQGQGGAGNTLITCIEISSHKDLIRVPVDVTIPRKALYVMVNDGLFNFRRKKIEEFVRDNLPELGVLNKINANSERFETCIKVSSISSIYRLNVKGEQNFSVCLVIPFGLSAKEREKIRVKAASDFPDIQVLEYRGRREKSNTWIVALIGGILAGVVFVLWYERDKERGIITSLKDYCLTISPVAKELDIVATH